MCPSLSETAEGKLRNQARWSPTGESFFVVLRLAASPQRCMGTNTDLICADHAVELAMAEVFAYPNDVSTPFTTWQAVLNCETVADGLDATTEVSSWQWAYAVISGSSVFKSGLACTYCTNKIHSHAHKHCMLKSFSNEACNHIGFSQITGGLSKKTTFCPAKKADG